MVAIAHPATAPAVARDAVQLASSLRQTQLSLRHRSRP